MADALDQKLKHWFDGRVVLVTGAGNGIGRAYALAFARHGARVVVNDLGGDASGKGASDSAADKVVEEIRAFGGEAASNYASVADRAGGEAMVKTALDKFGRLDAVVCNAGIISNGAFEDLTEEQIDKVLSVHLKGSFFTAQPAFKVMKAQKYGRFVFTSSGSGMFGHAWMGNYSAAKAGIIGLSHIVAQEGQPHGIMSNVIAPSGASRFGEFMGDGYLQLPELAANIARADFASVGKRGKPSYNAPLALYLASERCPGTHGVYSMIRGRYAECFFAVSKGWICDSDIPPSVDDIAAHWGQIADRSTYDVPVDVYDEFAIVAEDLKAAGK